MNEQCQLYLDDIVNINGIDCIHFREGREDQKLRRLRRDKLGFQGGEEKKDFHGFRHTVADHLKQLGVVESLIGGILGHQTGGIK